MDKLTMGPARTAHRQGKDGLESEWSSASFATGTMKLVGPQT